MGFRSIVAVAVMCLASSEAATSGFLSAMNSEYAELRVVLANTTKVLKESQAASKLATAPKPANVAAHEDKAPAKEVAKPAPAKEAAKPAAAKPEAKPVAAKPVAAKSEAKPAAGGLAGLPKHASKAQEAMIIKQLTAQEDALSKNLKDIKAMVKKDKADAGSEGKLENMMKGKDLEMFKGFDDFNKRANAKAAIGAMDVLSKLKKVVHFVKKGALSGDKKAADGLDGVIKEMTGMVGR